MISVSIAVSSGEEKKLLNCLNSIYDFADELIILDLREVKDKSFNLSKVRRLKIIESAPVLFIEAIRQKMINVATSEWILILDPDEELGGTLKEKLESIANQNVVDAVNIPRKNIFFGKWISHTNWWPDRHVRFFKKGKIFWESKIHSYPRVEGKIIDLPAKEELAIVHYGYDSVAQFVERQNRYSEVETKSRYNTGERFSWFSFFLWPSREFLVRYIKHLGFLDGFYGFALTYLMMIYKISVLIKMWERDK